MKSQQIAEKSGCVDLKSNRNLSQTLILFGKETWDRTDFSIDTSSGHCVIRLVLLAYPGLISVRAKCFSTLSNKVVGWSQI